MFSPTISQQPQPANVYTGRNGQFTVAATGLPPFYYQWFTTNGSGVFTPLTNGPGVSGATNTTLIIDDVTTSTPSEYRCVVSNYFGASTSSIAGLGIAAPTTSAFAQAVDAANPVAYWRLNETNSPDPGPTYAYDYYGGYTGIYGTNASNAFDGILGLNAPGWPGFESNNAALETFFNETNSDVIVPALNLNTNTVTITMWLYPESGQVQYTGLLLWRGADGSGGFNYGATANMLAYDWGDSSTPYQRYTGITPPADLWSFVALVVTPTNATIYMMNTNGLSSSSLAVNNPVMAFDSSAAIETARFHRRARSTE